MPGFRTICFAALFLAFISVPAVAEDTKAEADNPITRLAANTDELLKDMSDDDLKFVYSTRMRDGVIRAVHYIKETVSGAKDACVKEHPDMKDSLEKRYGEWWNAIEPRLKKAEENLNDTVSSRASPLPEKIRKHLDMVREAAEYTQDSQEKHYVTDKKACDYLLENMDKTEASLSKQLEETLNAIPLPETVEKTETPSATP